MALPKDGIGVPSSPVTRTRNMSPFVSPHLKRDPLVKSKGVMGFPLLSVSVAAEGPKPRPSLPWQLQQFRLSKISAPRLTLSAEVDGSIGIDTGAGTFSSAKRGEN